AEVGYGKASLAAIASRAGISKGVISYHFAGKDELIEQVVTTIYTAGAEFMLEHLQAAKTPTDALRAYLTSNIEFISRSRTEMLALGEIFVNHRKPDGTPAWGVAEEQPALDALSWLFDWGQREGAFRLFDHRVMALTIR
nr:helix-turn-helix domain-containing protein [Micromonospora sp. DSM 115978]